MRDVSWGERETGTGWARPGLCWDRGGLVPRAGILCGGPAGDKQSKMRPRKKVKKVWARLAWDGLLGSRYLRLVWLSAWIFLCGWSTLESAVQVEGRQGYIGGRRRL